MTLEAITFWALGALLLASALMVVLTKNLFHSVLYLALSLTVTQHLLQGWGSPVNTRQIRIAKNNREVSDLTFKAQPRKAAPSTSLLTEAAKAIVAHVTKMEPDEMPAELLYAD